MIQKFDENSPIYMQIMNLVKSDIVVGKLKIGDKLPSVRELSAELKVNPNTLQRAYQELERDGITYTQRGMGTFVREDEIMVKSLKKEMARGVISSFIEGMKNLGFNNEEIMSTVQEEIKEEKIKEGK